MWMPINFDEDTFFLYIGLNRNKNQLSTSSTFMLFDSTQNVGYTTKYFLSGEERGWELGCEKLSN